MLWIDGWYLNLNLNSTAQGANEHTTCIMVGFEGKHTSISTTNLWIVEKLGFGGAITEWQQVYMA